jgi:small subunit ribosomal protein S11
MADKEETVKAQEAATAEAVEAKTEDVSAEATEAPAEETAKAAPKKKKAKRSVPAGQVHVLATFNNTIVTFTDPKGSVLSISSAGACGFRGSKKGTAYAAQVAAEKAAQVAKQQYGFNKAEVFIKGVGLGRDSAVRALVGLDISIENIKDVTGIPHGGVRPRKARRV